jgi:hypothetical protein
VQMLHTLQMYMCTHACMCPSISHLAHHSQGLRQHHVPVTVLMHMPHGYRCVELLRATCSMVIPLLLLFDHNTHHSF